MSTKIQTIDAQAFQGTVFFSLAVHRPGNRAKVKDLKQLTEYLAQLHADNGERDRSVTPAVDLPRNIPTEMNGAVKVTKRLLLPKKRERDDQAPDPYEVACAFLSGTKDSLTGRFGLALPSRIKDGLFVVSKELVEQFETRLRAALLKLETDFIPAVRQDYPEAKRRAETTPVKDGGLGPLYREADYLSTDAFCEQFGLDWQWLALGVPEDLPAALRAEAAEKLERQFTEAAAEVKDALRVGFAELIAHATDKLTAKPGEKPAVFRDSLIGNIAQFCEVFSSRNVMGDSELAALVERARAVLTGADGRPMDPERIRKYASVREAAAKQFGELNSALDSLIMARPSRRFNLEEA